MITLPPGMELLASGRARGTDFATTPADLPEVATDSLADPLSDLCLRLAARLLQTVPADSRAQGAMVLASESGSLCADLDFDRSRREAGGRYASPAAFARTLPSTLAAELSLKLALHGPLLVLSGEDCRSLAISRAAAWLKGARLPWCLAGVCEHFPDEGPHAEFWLLRTSR